MYNLRHQLNRTSPISLRQLNQPTTLKENNIFEYDEEKRAPVGCVPILAIDKTESAETLKLE